MSNLIATPRLLKNKAILIKLEATYGTDPTPTGAANWIEARNATLTPYDAETADRNIELPYMGSSGKVIVGQWAKLSFDVLASGSGTAGDAPKYAPLLLACGMAETLTALTSAEYNLVSTDIDSVTCWVNIDGVYHKFQGARGECKGKMSAKGIPMLTFEFDGIYTGPTAAALPVVTRTGWQIDEGVNSINTTALTVNGTDLAFSMLDFSFGNKIARINLPGPQLEVAITDRASGLSMTVLAPPLATFNPFTLADSNASVDISVVHGTVAGRKLQLDGKVIVNGVEYADIDGMLAYKIAATPTPDSGNDELALTAL